MHPNLALPPEPVITRWGTWLEAALYYSKNINEFEEVVNSFDTAEAVSIGHVKDVLNLPAIRPRLAAIAAQFGQIPALLLKLESRDLLLHESIECVTGLLAQLHSSPGAIGKQIAEKMDAVLARNPGWSDICSLSSIIDGEGNSFLIF